ncbi:MAG: trimeric intracellular cation channel family protein [Gammaproteobacteria bacterium]|nr:trimeric intracellular cation channel family protein [Gammaproteobacteria bacterium]MDH3577719.1 trimeric intracellular cation channel family protein [Gammaproteobacteria bacterium]
MDLSFVYLLEMTGTAAFAASGALAASRKNMDIFGFCVLALMPAVGGGTIRDIIIDRVPVFWIADNRYIAVAIIVALIVFFTSYRPGSRRQILIWMDALGLALFAALGTEICLHHETGPLVAVMLGVTTAVTGGMIRDIICNEIPLILSREIYATAAFITAVCYVLADNIGLGESLSLGVAVIAGFAVRALAIIYNWSLPSFGMHKGK